MSNLKCVFGTEIMFVLMFVIHAARCAVEIKLNLIQFTVSTVGHGTQPCGTPLLMNLDKRMEVLMFGFKRHFY